MSATSAPFGFVAVRHPSGEARARQYNMAANAVEVYKGMPVALDTNGTIAAAGSATDLLGIFVGVEYINAKGVPVTDNYWPTGGVAGATNIRAWVVDDPEVEYVVQANGSVPQTGLGDEADLVPSTANAGGVSQMMLSATLAGVGVGAQFRITGFDRSVDNVAGDAFTKVLVKINRHQFRVAKNAI